MSIKQNPIPRFYGIEFVAERLGVTKKSIYRWIDEGALHVHRFQGVLRISEGDLECFINASRK
jgi:excisionase family DNA binding protein